MGNVKIDPAARAALKISIIYLAVTIPWILFSDQVVLFLFQRAEDLTRIQTFKGWGFILFTALLIFFLLKNEMTKHVRTQKSLTDSERKYRLMIENTPDLIYRTDMNGAITFISPSVFKLSGYTVEEAIGVKMAEQVYLVPEERDQFLAELAEKAVVKNFEARLKRKDGTVWWASTNAHFLTDEKGTPIGVEGVTRDITEKKLAEKNRFENEQRLRTIFEANPDPMVMYDTIGHPEYMNPAFTDVFGWTLDELKDRKIPFVPEEEIAPSMEKIKEIYAHGVPLSFETKRLTKNGRILDVIVSAAVGRNESGELVGMVVNLKDISGKKELEAQFEQAQKMESLGTLAGGIAHDFNNFLAGMFGYVDLAKKHAQNPKVTDYLSRAIQSLDRAKGMTRQLLTFAKGGAPVKEIGDLAPFIEETTRFALSGANVSCSFDLPQDLWTSEYDKAQIGQVIDNIVINAQHAMPSGGNIHVRAENMALQEKDKSTLQPGRYIRISIADTGTGIPEKYIKQIFDPFFSTKQTGSGLGLATAYSIVTRHGGIIDVSSDPGIGSVFHIYLPASKDTVKAEESVFTAPFEGTGKILVMDDEQLIREMLDAMLTKVGFSCVAASDGEEAVRLFVEAQKQENPFSGVILDMTIPGGMGGKQAVRLIRNNDEKVPVFIASGYSEDEAIADPPSFGFTDAIEKPFTMDQLTAVLRKYL